MNKELVMTFGEFKEKAEMFPDYYNLTDLGVVDDNLLGIAFIDNQKKVFKQIEFTIGAFKVINR